MRANGWPEPYLVGVLPAWRKPGVYFVTLVSLLDDYLCANRCSRSSLTFYLGQREFAKQSVYDAHLQGKKHIKAASQLSSNPPNGHSNVPTKDTKVSKDRNLAKNEAMIAAYGGELGAIREDTRMNVERKQALTDKERVSLGVWTRRDSELSI